jgi:putative resolvase
MGEMVIEVGSGLNGKRQRFKQLLADPQVTMITLEHRGWLTHSGVEHPEAALSAQGRGLSVVDPGEPGDDLERNMIDVPTSLCAWLHGRPDADNGTGA